ncbi:hypothetical protein D9757_002674 [Collybiopsis confluens]|uniref:SHSP domain-containing protein n=1 Tax=Collybiopsis confluens TaxID=2823264 RepID=A0A8H5HW22_9AGAR|nr:hypothetical protein D9757_002674 [Collybiopsis confluens]
MEECVRSAATRCDPAKLVVCVLCRSSEYAQQSPLFFWPFGSPYTLISSNVQQRLPKMRAQRPQLKLATARPFACFNHNINPPMTSCGYSFRSSFTFDFLPLLSMKDRFGCATPTVFPKNLNPPASPPTTMYGLPRIEVTSQPSVSTPLEEFSPMQRERRAPSNTPPPDIETFHSNHTIRIQLPRDIKHEMVTISVLKGDKLKIIADAWHMEDTDSHFEWVVNFFPQDVDMSSVQARFDSGLLVIDVRRLSPYHAE